MKPKAVGALHPAEGVFVPRERELRVEATLQENLHAARVDDLLEFGPKNLAREHVPFAVTDGPVECTEPAACGAHVRVVDVAIDDVRDDPMRVLAQSNRVGREAQVEERGFVEEALALGHRKSFAFGSARENSVEAWRQ